MFLSVVVRSCYLNSRQAVSLLGSPSGAVTGLAKTESAHKFRVVPLGGFYPPFRRCAALPPPAEEGIGAFAASQYLRRLVGPVFTPL